jgi:16S rRNA (guanine1516-N2)-methyltransferase
MARGGESSDAHERRSLGKPNKTAVPPRRETPEVTLCQPCRGDDVQLAAAFGVRVVVARDPTRWQLVRTPTGLELTSPDALGPMRLALHADRGDLARRLRTLRRSDPLPRALGLPRRQDAPSVFDATAGLGRDAMALATLGCRVVACERIPALALLTAAASAAAAFAERLQVLVGDAVVALARCSDPTRPDVVYLDPMFGEPGTAQVKKDMQVCRLLAGPPEDPTALFVAAKSAARERVVVKRHKGEAPLAAGVSFAVAGERIRFDVYLRGEDGNDARSGAPVTT